MNENTQAEFRAHAQREYPRECCGLVAVVKGKETYFPCNNIARTPSEHFMIDPAQYDEVEECGEIIAVCHSHPDVLPTPSEHDKVSCEATGLEWHIVHVSIPDGTNDPPLATDIHSFKPTGYEAPLVGRTFAHGTLDCYSLVKDYYSRELAIELPEFERRDDWWLNGENLYMDNFEAAGFSPIKGQPRIGDIILMQIRSKVPNHAGIYLGNGRMLHHYHSRLSTREVYGGYWLETTRVIIRRNNNG